MKRAVLVIAVAMFAAPAFADESHMGMGDDPAPTIFNNVRTELDYTPQEGGLVTWDVDGWVGGDKERVWLRSEGELERGDAKSAEVQLYYGWNFHPYWDALVGIRQDIEPRSTTYLAASIVGLAKYDFETEASLFVSQRGDFSARIKQRYDFLITQRLIAEPYAELNLNAQDVPELNEGSGLTQIQAGLQLRYEVTRKFAPYIDAVWQRKVGETSSLARAAGEDPEQATLRLGLRWWF